MTASLLPQGALSSWLIGLILISCVLDWIVVSGASKTLLRFEYLTKPAVPLLLLVLILTSPSSYSLTQLFLAGAMIFCLGGDVALMLPDPKGNRFLLGLGSFLVAHLFFILCLLRLPRGNIFVGVLVVVALAVTPTFIVVRSISRKAKKLVLPVLVYIAVLLAMATCALAVGLSGGLPTVLIAVGAVSFVTSDLLLAVHRFVRPIPNETVLVHVSYHAAIVLLTLGVLDVIA